MSQYQYIGELPNTGVWRFLLVTIKGQTDVIVVWDKSGRHSPRMVIEGKLVDIAPLAC